MNRTRIVKLVVYCLAQLTVISAARAIQAGQEIVIPLKLNLNAKNSIGVSVNFGERKTVADPGTTSMGIAPGGVKVSVEKPTESEDVCIVRIDCDGDGDLEKETAYTMKPDSSIRVEVVRRRKTGSSIKLPYIVKYNRDTNSKNEMTESLFWTSNYRAEGTLQVGSCQAMIAAFDINGDGVFDNRDFLMGTSIGLDRNEDGEISGRDEWLMGNQIIEFCGKQFLIEKLADDGSSMTLVPTLLKSPKVGETIPDLIFTTTKGKKIATTQLKGRATILDFWASWCGPCVREFPILRKLHEEFNGQFNVIAVNVDEARQISQARKVVEKYKLSWPVVMQGLGQADPTWKMFGSIENNRLAIPFYVIMDKDGTIRYAGHGGDGLKDLRNRLTDTVK